MQSRLLFARTGNIRPSLSWSIAFRAGQLRRSPFAKALQTSSTTQAAAAQQKQKIVKIAVPEYPSQLPRDSRNKESALFGKEQKHLDPTNDELETGQHRGSEVLPALVIKQKLGYTVKRPPPTPSVHRRKSTPSLYRLSTRKTISNEIPLQYTLEVVQRAEIDAIACVEAVRRQSIENALADEEEEMDDRKKFLKDLHYVPTEELHEITSILDASTAEEAVRRYISSECHEPHRVMSELLRRDNISTKTFRKLIIYAWRRCMGRHSLELSVKAQEEAFIIMICRLLDRARKLFAPAVVSIAHMMVENFEQLSAASHLVENKLPAATHARLSKHYNIVLQRLSLPAALHPFKSMIHNWRAQRVLLESANNFQAPLELDRLSYRSVCTVLLALKKSPQEVKFSNLLERSWPPWRRDQDGMDADRPVTQDLSRVNQAMAQMTGAGYGEETTDRVINILGGRDTDGTPTIQTRSLLGIRTQLSIPILAHLVQDNNPDTTPEEMPVVRFKPRMLSAPGPPVSPTTEEWAARIEATRDVQEAWAAFSSYPKEAGSRSQSMYFAMMKKLVYDDKLAFLGQRESSLPGDGPEVFPVVDDNLSDDLKLRLKPPQRDELYRRLIDEGHHPKGRFLAFLIFHAKTPRHVIQYLLDSDLEPLDVQRLISPNRSLISRPVRYYQAIPQYVLVAFIHFLSRSFTWHNTRHDTEPSSALEDDPFGHAFCILQLQYEVCRPAWNALLEGLAKRGIAIDYRRDFTWNEQSSWAFLFQVYQKSQELGLELDHEGFLFICRGLEKALLAETDVPTAFDGETFIDQGRQLLKDKFRELGQKEAEEFYLPALTSRLGISEIHAYIRVIGICRDVDELKFVSQWLLENSKSILEEADESHSGPVRLRRAVVAIRIFADQSMDDAPDTVASIRSIVDELDECGGWPDDAEILEYRKAWEEGEKAKDSGLYRYWQVMELVPENTERQRWRSENLRIIEELEGESVDSEVGDFGEDDFDDMKIFKHPVHR